jgi:hypothetical protein
MFHPHLRKDGMGIDYTNISYRFQDPEKKTEETARKQMAGAADVQGRLRLQKKQQMVRDAAAAAR